MGVLLRYESCGGVVVFFSLLYAHKFISVEIIYMFKHIWLMAVIQKSTTIKYRLMVAGSVSGGATSALQNQPLRSIRWFAAFPRHPTYIY